MFCVTVKLMREGPLGPTYRRGIRTTFGVDANGEVSSGLNHEGESTDATPRGGLPRRRDEAESCRGVKRVGHLRRDRNGPTGNRRTPLVFGGGRRGAAALADGTSRVTVDCHARICERLGVKFPGPTRPSADHTCDGPGGGPSGPL